MSLLVNHAPGKRSFVSGKFSVVARCGGEGVAICKTCQSQELLVTDLSFAPSVAIQKFLSGREWGGGGSLSSWNLPMVKPPIAWWISLKRTYPDMRRFNCPRELGGFSFIFHSVLYVWIKAESHLAYYDHCQRNTHDLLRDRFDFMNGSRVFYPWQQA